MRIHRLKFRLDGGFQSRTTATAAPAGPAPPIKRIPDSESNEILARQRVHRPISPHLTIYKPQITWYLSALHRITGSVLAGALYTFATAYLVSPLLGWHLDSQSIAEAFSTLPYVAKIITKFVLAAPFTFHFANGIRHLVWDTGKALSNEAVIRTGWTVVAISLVTAAATLIPGS